MQSGIDAIAAETLVSAIGASALAGACAATPSMAPISIKKRTSRFIVQPICVLSSGMSNDA